MYVRIVLMLDMISWIIYIYIYVRIMLDVGYDRLDHLYVFVYASCWMLGPCICICIRWIHCMIRWIMYGDMYHVFVFVSGGYIDDQEDHV